MKANDFDKKFDEGKEDILDDLDLDSAFRPNFEKKRVNVDFPAWMIREMDYEAKRLGVNRQALIKTLVAGHLDSQRESH